MPKSSNMKWDRLDPVPGLNQICIYFRLLKLGGTMTGTFPVQDAKVKKQP